MSETKIPFGEQFQENAVGRTMLRPLVGSRSPAYQQLIWRTGGIASSRIDNGIEAPGNEHVGKVPRFWKNAAVLSASVEDLEYIGAFDDFEEVDAVAYFDEEHNLHVGTPRINNHLYEYSNNGSVTVAMRLGRGPLRASMGVWVPSSRKFVPTASTQLDNPRIAIDKLPGAYPDTVLV